MKSLFEAKPQDFAFLCFLTKGSLPIETKKNDKIQIIGKSPYWGRRAASTKIKLSESATVRAFSDQKRAPNLP